MTCESVTITHFKKNSGGGVLEVQYLEQDGVTPKDISQATGLVANLQKPSGVWASPINAAFSNGTGTDGKQRAVIVADYLDMPGYWRWHMDHTISGRDWPTDDYLIYVEDAP